MEASVPNGREEKHEAILDVGEDEAQPPESAQASLVHEMPEQDGVEDESFLRIQEVVCGNLLEVAEIDCMDDIQ